MKVEVGSIWLIIILLAAVIILALSSTTAARAAKQRIRHAAKRFSLDNTTVHSRNSINYDEIYTNWTPWRKCSSRCNQVRRRICRSPQHCGSNILREVRKCRGNKCTDKPNVIPNGDILTAKGSDTRVLYHLQHFVYSDWSPWSSCTRTCRTHRTKKCKMALVCGDGLIQEDALCYVKGSICEKLYKRKKRQEEKKKKKKRDKKDKERNYEMVGVNKREDSKNKNDSNNNCGVSDVSQDLRIIGGQVALKDKWPWQVIILDKFRTPYCGGIILSPTWILTAAHCVKRRRRLRIRAGELDLAKEEGTEQEIRVSETYIHPEYDIHTVNNDIALLRLRQSLSFNRHVKPICLPDQGEELSLNSVVTILGWGKKRNTAIYGSDLLQQAEVPIVDLTDCKEVYEDYYISDNMLCAGFKRGGVDSCEGDSGGPLLYKKERKWIIYGVTSFGEGCGRKGKYGIYAKVSNFVKWIKRTMSRNKSPTDET